MWGEFGRTPKIGGCDPDGRGHWPSVMSALIAGVKMARSLFPPAPGPRCERPTYRVSSAEPRSTRTLGIDPAQTFPNGSGRPMSILDDREQSQKLL